MSRFFHATMTLVVLVALTISAYGMHVSNIRVEFHQLLPKLALYALVLAVALFYRYRQADKLMSALLVVFWMGLVSDLHVYPMFLAGRQPVGFSDDLLAKMDARIGLEVTEVMAWIEAYPWAKFALEQVYFTLVFLMALSLLSTTLLGKFKAAQEYVISCVCAVALSFPLFAVFQAHGPWTYYGYTCALNQEEYMRVFAELKAAEVYTMDLSYANGLMCFPSFHTILAVLAGAAVWPIPFLRWLGILWAGLIVLSTVTTGTHYIIDVIAGLGVAALSLLGAKVFSRIESRMEKSRTDPVATSPMTNQAGRPTGAWGSKSWTNNPDGPPTAIRTCRTFWLFL